MSASPNHPDIRSIPPCKCAINYIRASINRHNLQSLWITISADFQMLVRNIIQAAYGIPGVFMYFIVIFAMRSQKRILSKSFISIFAITAIIVGFFLIVFERVIIISEHCDVDQFLASYQAENRSVHDTLLPIVRRSVLSRVIRHILFIVRLFPIPSVFDL